MEQTSNPYKSAEKLELKDIKENLPKVFKKVNCPSCEKDIDASNINLQNSVAKCSGCNVIFSIQEEVEGVKTKNETKQYIFRPEGIDLFFYKEDLEISIKQHLQGLDAFGLIFLPFLSALSIFIYFAKGIPIIIPIILTLGALYFIYKAFNYSDNKTFVDINDKFLHIRSRPKNLKKDRTYAVNDIDQVYIKHSPDGVGLGVYMIVNTLDGQKHELLVSVNSLSKAKYLEQEIESYLHIEDRAVLEAQA